MSASRVLLLAGFLYFAPPQLLCSALLISYPFRSCLILSCLILSCLILSCLILSCLILSCLIIYRLTLSCLVLSALTLSYLLRLALKRYLGDGPKLVRELFRVADEMSPTLVFIDEIDAVGSKRYDSNSGGTREIQRTMLELLNQLDGFDERGDVKVR